MSKNRCFIFHKLICYLIITHTYIIYTISDLRQTVSIKSVTNFKLGLPFGMVVFRTSEDIFDGYRFPS